jgi:hypothetical protein
VYDEILRQTEGESKEEDGDATRRVPVRRGPAPASVGHRDAILDLKAIDMQTHQRIFLVSSSRDGSIKVWM